MMKKYLTAIILGTIIAPPLGATIYGTLMGNPIIIFWPAVLAVAYIVEGLPFVLFGTIGSLIHRKASMSGKTTTPGAAAVYGLLMGAACALLPLMLAMGKDRWTLNYSILSFLATGALTGLICATSGNQFLNRTDGSANKAVEGMAPR